ncbi:MAG TPA: TRAP transporter permease [Syntrophales bacterium]|nr:TRAP transporter permease [Syntrophales bacterium]HPO36068.1 TRAP transporter permease [Syntrophales bacterium]
MGGKAFFNKRRLVELVAIVMGIFHLYTAQFGLFTATIQRSIHLLFVCIIVYLTVPLFKKQAEGKKKVFASIVDTLLIVASAVTLIYLVVEYKNLYLKGGEAGVFDLVFGTILIVIVIDITRRTIGWPLPIITLIAIAYSFFGHYIPGSWGHRMIDFEQFISYQYLTTEGLFSIPLGVSASFIFIFVLFAAFLLLSGVGQFFINIANGIAGGWRGGPAKVAIVASSLFGTISGSAVANVSSVGTFTVPLMKKMGYSSVMAGAVESVASTGGQIMPPIMGAAAFIVAEMVGITYLKVCVAAAIPAVLYYFSLFYIAHLEAIKVGMEGLPKEQLPSVKKELTTRGHLVIPAILLVVLLIYGYSPMKAGFWSIVALIVVSYIKRETRMDWGKIVESFTRGAMGVLSVATCCACAGIVIGVVTQTGLGLKFSNLVISAAQGKLLLTLFYTMIAALILGMGLTTSAAYILTAIIAAPALIDLGVKPLVAHLFVFYYACLSTITPPVALASYAAAGIAEAPPFRVGYRAMWLAIVAYIVPYFFVYNPALLFQGPLWFIAFSFFTAIIGCMAIGSAVEGFVFARITWPERILLFFAGLCLIAPGMREAAIGFILFFAIIIFRFFTMKKSINKGG